MANRLQFSFPLTTERPQEIQTLNKMPLQQHPNEQNQVHRTTRICLAIVLMATGVAGTGCKQSPRVVPVAGMVLYNDKPLPFGTIMFQPDRGQPASGEIQSDGSFKLSSYAHDDGAVPGRHIVSITCYEGQRPSLTNADNAGETSLGKLLIPLKYTRTGSSGLFAQIEDAPNQSVEFKLTGPPLKF